MERVPLKKSILYRKARQRNVWFLILALLAGGFSIVFWICGNKITGANGANRRGVFSALIMMSLMFSFAVCSAVYLLYLFVRKLRDPFAHSSLKGLLRYPDYEVLLAMMDKELKGRRKCFVSCFGGCIWSRNLPPSAFFTESFFLNDCLFGLDWVLCREICWAYMRVRYTTTTRRTEGELYLFLDSGRKKRMRVDPYGDAYAYLQRVAPFAFYGDTRDLASRWRTNRYGMIKAVRVRRAAFLEDEDER